MPRLLVEGVSETSVKNIADQYTPMLNRGIALMHRVLTGKDAVLTAKVALPSYTSLLQPPYITEVLIFVAYTCYPVHVLRAMWRTAY